MRKFILHLLLCLSFVNTIAQNNLRVDIPYLKGEESMTSTEHYTLVEEAEGAFKKMQKAAKEEEVSMKIVSSFRSYNDQKRIWNNKYKRFLKEGLTPEKVIEKIIQYSTLPGTSRHHWGTEIDIIDPNPDIEGDVLLAKHFHTGPYQKLREWLEQNAHTYGFYLVYTKDSLRKGFNYEPWHYSYYPKSNNLLKQYLTLHVLEEIKKDTLLLGHQYLDERFIKKYKQEHILGINPLLKNWK